MLDGLIEEWEALGGDQRVSNFSAFCLYKYSRGSMKSCPWDSTWLTRRRNKF